MYYRRGHEKWHATILVVKSSNVLEKKNNIIRINHLTSVEKLSLNVL